MTSKTTQTEAKPAVGGKTRATTAHTSDDRQTAFDAIPLDGHSGPNCPCARCAFQRFASASDALRDAAAAFVTDSDQMRRQWDSGDWRAILDLNRRHVEALRAAIAKTEVSR